MECRLVVFFLPVLLLGAGLFTRAVHRGTKVPVFWGNSALWPVYLVLGAGYLLWDIVSCLT